MRLRRLVDGDEDADQSGDDRSADPADVPTPSTGVLRAGAECGPTTSAGRSGVPPGHLLTFGGG